jgi:hypothetical protein
MIFVTAGFGYEVRRLPIVMIGIRHLAAGWSSPVARQAHNLKVAGSNPAPATNLMIQVIQ